MAEKKIDKTMENIDYLYKTLLKMETYEECEALLDDMCTKTELASIAQRLVVAKMLSEKRVYSDIVAETGASTATISRVNRSLAFGKGGYAMIFAKED
jgi:TrpR-related protein YerC/YecD